MLHTAIPRNVQDFMNKSDFSFLGDLAMRDEEAFGALKKNSLAITKTSATSLSA